MPNMTVEQCELLCGEAPIRRKSFVDNALCRITVGYDNDVVLA